jgi:hypothetical protein
MGDSMDEVRAILAEGSRPKDKQPKSGALTEAVELIRTRQPFSAALQLRIDAMNAALKEAAEKAGRGDNALEVLRGEPLSALRKLSETVTAALAHVESVVGGDGPMAAQYVAAMDKIKPGDKIMLTQQVFRVIGKTGNSALVQPDAIAKGIYGTFVPAPGPVKSPGDYPGRGGDDFGDAVVNQPKGMLTNPQGHISLVGTQVLKYNPHTGLFSFPSERLPGEYEMADTIQIVGHDAAMPFAVGEGMTVDRFTMILDEAHGTTTIDKLRVITQAGVPMKVHGVYVDQDTAEAAITMYDGLREDNRRRMTEMTVTQILAVMLRMTKQAA